ncbi:hypothetical protein QQP08_005608 [Theobroma cacao]|nr:hypothetical protein QQP08_005608 [Theobroma cacao]
MEMIGMEKYQKTRMKKEAVGTLAEAQSPFFSRFPTSGGKAPLNELLARFTDLDTEERPITSFGMVPFRRPVALDNVGGIGPVNRFTPTANI